MIRQIRAYLATLTVLSRTRLIVALSLAVLLSLTEGLGIALLLPTLQVAGFDLTRQGEAGRYAAIVTHALVAVGLRPTLSLMLVIFVLLVSARAMLNSAHSVASYSVNEQVALGLRRSLYDAITGAGWPFIVRRRASDFNHALTAEIERVVVATQQLMILAADLMLVLLYVAIAFTLSPSLTALVLALGAILSFLLRGRTRFMHASGVAISDATRRLYAAVTDHLHNLKTLKSYGAERRSSEIFSALAEGVARTTVATIRHEAFSRFGFETGSILALGAVVYLSIRLIAVPPAEILILLLLFSRVMPRFMSMHQSYRTFASLLPSFANIAGLEAQCRAAADPSDLPARFELRDAVRLEQVSFAYPNAARPAVRGLEIVIPAGCITAIVGPSGAGKSTVADLVMGLIAPAGGRVTIDGAALDPARARAWRERLGYVAQDSFLFHDTVRANLLWAHPAADEPAMRAALQMAAADEFVRALPAGLDAVVGDRGALLSDGERRRLALARALLRRPLILVLDEATNSLDSENEARVLDALARLRGRLTTLLITHRMSAIRWADLIYVLEDGCVVESGDWETLSARRDGRFRALCSAQSLSP